MFLESKGSITATIKTICKTYTLILFKQRFGVDTKTSQKCHSTMLSSCTQCGISSCLLIIFEYLVESWISSLEIVVFEDYSLWNQTPWVPILDLPVIAHVTLAYNFLIYRGRKVIEYMIWEGCENLNKLLGWKKLHVTMKSNKNAK